MGAGIRANVFMTIEESFGRRPMIGTRSSPQGRLITVLTQDRIADLGEETFAGAEVMFGQELRQPRPDLVSPVLWFHYQPVLPPTIWDLSNLSNGRIKGNPLASKTGHVVVGSIVDSRIIVHPVELTPHFPFCVLVNFVDLRDIPLLRPAFQQLMVAVEAGLLRWLVADRQDRFGTKDKYQFIAFMHQLREGRCRFYTVDGKCWNDDSMMSFFEGGMGAETSEKEQKEKGWRVLQAQILKARRGEWAGGHIAYGMDIACNGTDGQEKWRVVVEGRDLIGTKPGKRGRRRRLYSTRRLKVWPDGTTERFDGQRNFPATELNDTLRLTPSRDKAKIAVVREVFDKFAVEDISATQIAVYLNRLDVQHHYADRWEHYHVREMLKNPIYIGFQRWNSNGQGRFFEYLEGEARPVQDRNGRREREEGDWILSDHRLFEPLIPDRTWQSVQARLAKTPRQRRSPRSAGLWLSGLLFCSHCQQEMRGQQRPTRNEYFCSTYAKKKGNSSCLRNCVNHEIIEAEIRRYLKETGQEVATILDAHQTGNLELLKPYEQKHFQNIVRSGEALVQMLQSVVSHGDWEQIVERFGGAARKIRPPETLPEFHEAWKEFWLPVQKAYQSYFRRDHAEIEERLKSLDAEHSQLTERILSLDPKSATRAIAKANARIAEIEQQMTKIENSLTNWSERYQAARDEMFAHVLAFDAAQAALDDPAASNRRKSLAVRACIQRVNLTFRPTGKKYPTSELVEIEIIPISGVGPEGPNGASGCRARGPP